MNLTHKYKIARNWADIKEVVKNCQKTKYCSHDFETNAEHPAKISSYPTIIGISYQPSSSIIIPLGHSESKWKDNYKPILDYLGEELISNKEITKIAWNAKFENQWWIKYGWNFEGRVFDGMLAKHLLDEERPHGLGDVVLKLIEAAGDYKDDTEQLARKHGWANIPIDELGKRCALDCDLTLRLMLHLEQKLISGDFYKLFRNLYMPLSKVLATSEFKGMPIDVPYLDGLVDSYGKKIADLEKKVRAIPVLKRYERKKKKRVIKELIRDTKAEIKVLKAEGKTDSDRVITNRIEKISRYIAGELVTNKERDKMEPLNFDSPKQMIDLLFDSKYGFKFEIVKYTKDKHKQDTDSPSTDEEVLLVLRKKDKTGFIDGLLKYRELAKLYGTYIVGIKERLVGEKIHGSFLLHGTVTGRLSSKNPNMQNIPRSTTNSDIKRMYVPPKGQLLVEVDYSQAELRVVAELAHDEAMLDIFRKNYNIHVATACKMNNRLNDYDKIKGIIARADEMDAKELEKPENKEFLKWAKEKKKGKTLNFSILYMQSDEMTAEQMGVTKEQATRFKKEWFKAFPGIKRWMEKQEKFVEKHGYVKTLFGQKRRLPDIWSDIRGFKNKAIRDCINMPIQGTSGQFTTFAMVNIQQQMDLGIIQGITQIPYTVHDSIGFFMFPEAIPKAVKQISGICENPETLKYFGFEMKDVRMKVSAEVGKDWANLKPFDPWVDYKSWV